MMHLSRSPYNESFTITVTDVNDAPVFASATGTGSVAENAAISTVIYTAFATDEDNDTLTYSVSGNDASSITIDASTGAVTLNSSADYETKSSYSFTVTATDGDGATDTQAVTVSVTDVNETPVFASSTASISVAENSDVSTVIYTAFASDVDGDTLTYSLTGADDSLLTIDPVTGEVRFNASPDYETKNQYLFTVTASDGALTDTVDVTLDVTDVNDAPVFASATGTWECC